MFEKDNKYELSILRRLAMAQEKPEGGLLGPPAPNRVKFSGKLMTSQVGSNTHSETLEITSFECYKVDRDVEIVAKIG